MTGKKKSADDSGQHPVGVDVLDGLIKNYYEKLIRVKSEDIKIGDFLKMVEMRKKLMPSQADQEKFWKMLDDIRRKNLPSDGKEPLKPSKKVKRQDG
ncbi:MAG: hypothetical protein AB1483_04155 [Candidatus Zixiibacteriota bacterium]